MARMRDTRRKVTRRRSKSTMKRQKIPMPILGLRVRAKRAGAVKSIVRDLVRQIAQ